MKLEKYVFEESIWCLGEKHHLMPKIRMVEGNMERRLGGTALPEFMEHLNIVVGGESQLQKDWSNARWLYHDFYNNGFGNFADVEGLQDALNTVCDQGYDEAITIREMLLEEGEKGICPECGGSGDEEDDCHICWGDDDDCSECDGYGYTYEHCWNCYGTGQVTSKYPQGNPEEYFDPEQYKEFCLLLENLLIAILARI